MMYKKKYYFYVYEFPERWIHALVGKLTNNCFYWFPAAMLVPIRMGVQHGVSKQSSINLGKWIIRISCFWKIALPWILARDFAYSPSFHFPDFGLKLSNGFDSYIWWRSVKTSNKGTSLTDKNILSYL